VWFPIASPAASVPRVARRPQISREYLEAHRRRRYVDAVAELLHEFGREGASVSNIVRMAGTARNSFYEVFAGGEDCIAYGIGVAVGELFEVVDGQDGAGEWAAEVEDAIAGFYRVVAADPILAELFLIHAAASRVEDGRAATLAGAERFAALFSRGRAEAEQRGLRVPPLLADEYFSRAVVAVAAQRVREPEVAELPDQSRGIAMAVVGFYLGSEAADHLLGTAAREPARS
jgi:AcrR family transcriptional regulator